MQWWNPSTRQLQFKENEICILDYIPYIYNIGWKYCYTIKNYVNEKIMLNKTSFFKYAFKNEKTKNLLKNINVIKVIGYIAKEIRTIKRIKLLQDSLSFL